MFSLASNDFFVTFPREDTIAQKQFSKTFMVNPAIVIAGGSGLIGSACRDLFTQEGYSVYVLTRRREAKAGEISWNPDEQWIEKDIIDRASAVINLCGLSLADKRWSVRYQKLLLESRVVPTQFLHKLISESATPPECYVGVSGIGIYGDQSSRPILDDSEIEASGFIPELVKSWEHAHREIHQSRNVILRTGVVITAGGGFLGKLIPPMKFGLFPYFGTGKQILSWIQIIDFCQLVLHCLRTPSMKGIYHATAPGSISHRELMRTLKTVTRRPGLVFSVPEIFLRLWFGQMASILFESADVQPDKIRREGFVHAYPDIQSALQKELNTKSI